MRAIDANDMDGVRARLSGDRPAAVCCQVGSRTHVMWVDRPMAHSAGLPTQPEFTICAGYPDEIAERKFRWIV